MLPSMTCFHRATNCQDPIATGQAASSALLILMLFDLSTAKPAQKPSVTAFEGAHKPRKTVVVKRNLAVFRAF